MEGRISKSFGRLMHPSYCNACIKVRTLAWFSVE